YSCSIFSFLTAPSSSEIYTLSLHDALPICLDTILKGAALTYNKRRVCSALAVSESNHSFRRVKRKKRRSHEESNELLVSSPKPRSEEHTSELQSRENLVCRLLLEKKKKRT